MLLKFMFSKKATKIDEIFAANMKLCSNCQIDGDNFIHFCGLLRKHELYSRTLNKLFTVLAGNSNLMNYTKI